MEPSRLPAELFDSILNCATQGRTDVSMLCRFALVSHRWRAILNPSIYSQWMYDGEHHSIKSLWSFLLSVLCNQEIAHAVFKLDLRNWTLGLNYSRGRLVLSEDDYDLVRKALQRTGLQCIEEHTLRALQKADPRPIVALLLASLPNLTELYAHLPGNDIFFTEVLRKAASNEQEQSTSLLSALREICLTNAWDYLADKRRGEHGLQLDRLAPVFSLPNIRTISFFSCKPPGFLENCKHVPRTLGITDLTLVYCGESILRRTDTLALLALPKALTSLSLYFNDREVFRRIMQTDTQISNTDLWDGIRQHESSLVHLDIYRDSDFVIPFHRPGNSHFGSMKGFQRLETLCIQPEVLLGGCCKDDPAPFQLIDTLPPSLESLTFYGDEGLARNETLSQQIQGILALTRFPRLHSIMLEESFRHISYYAKAASLLYDDVEQACIRSGKKYETRRASLCTKGGINSVYYQQAEENRLQMFWKPRDVRFALKEYLSRLRKPEAGGTNPEGHPPELSLEDLDTFELPWEELTEERLYPYMTDSEELEYDDSFSNHDSEEHNIYDRN